MKKLLALVLAVTAFALAGCGGSADKPADNAKAEKVVKVGASPVPHAEILEAIRPELEKEGVKLEIVEFNDYVQPNIATNDKEIEAPQLPRTLDDVDISVINTNWAMQADLVPTRDALIMEDKTSPYVNILVVRQGDENRPEIQALVKALHSETVKNFINDKYKGAIVPAF